MKKEIIKKVFNKLIGKNIYDILHNFKTILIYKTQIYLNYYLNIPCLNYLGKYFGTDKYDEVHTFNNNSYLQIYESFFNGIRKRKLNILEIGVKNGASLRTWKAYFNYSNIYGIDIDPNCNNYQEEKEIGSQDYPIFLTNIFGEKVDFDLIIDDGSHVMEHLHFGQ